jgi:hypothetical protein
MVVDCHAEKTAAVRVSAAKHAKLRQRGSRAASCGLEISFAHI